jgi:hypothetical protein
VQLARDEIDRVFGADYAATHPNVMVAVLNAASSDWAASRLAAAIETVAAALVEDEPHGNGGIVPASQLMRP